MIEWDIDDMVEKVTRDLDGQVPEWRVREVVLELANKYSGAKVKNFVPILLRRQSVERLQEEGGRASSYAVQSEAPIEASAGSRIPQ